VSEREHKHKGQMVETKSEKFAFISSFKMRLIVCGNLQISRAKMSEQLKHLIPFNTARKKIVKNAMGVLLQVFN
jgi:hypothetical protein